MMDGWYHDGVGWGGWLVMTLAMVAFWVLVVVAVIAVFRGAGSTGSSDRRGSGGPDARTILDERFARGEIDADEYQSRHAELQAAARDRVL